MAWASIADQIDTSADWGPSGTPIAVAQVNAEAQKIAAEMQSGAARYGSEQQTRQARIQAQYGLQSAQTAADASRFGSQKQFEAAQLPIKYKQGVFDALFPYYQKAFGSILDQQGSGGTGGIPTLQPPPSYGGGGGGGSPAFKLPDAPALPAAPEFKMPNIPDAPNLPKYAPPSQMVQAPYIDPTTNSVISPALLNSQINSQLAQNQQMAGNQIQQMRGGLGGRGVGGASPLNAALTNQTKAMLIAANSQSALGLQNNAQTQNANYAQAMNQAWAQQAGAENTALINANQGAYGDVLQSLMGGYTGQLGLIGNLVGTQGQYLAATHGTDVNALAQLYGTMVGGATSAYGTEQGAAASEYGSYAQYLANLEQVRASEKNALINALGQFSNA